MSGYAVASPQGTAPTIEKNKAGLTPHGFEIHLWSLILTACARSLGPTANWVMTTTHQGSRNMVATLNPIRTHMSMKTGRLSGTHATVATAGMKS